MCTVLGFCCFDDYRGVGLHWVRRNERRETGRGPFLLPVGEKCIRFVRRTRFRVTRYTTRYVVLPVPCARTANSALCDRYQLTVRFGQLFLNLDRPRARGRIGRLRLLSESVNITNVSTTTVVISGAHAVRSHR